MHLKSFRVRGFSAFKDSDWIELSRDFNLFVGTNNSGKSALLKSLQLPLPSTPHIQTTPPNLPGGHTQTPEVQLSFSIAANDLIQRFIDCDVLPNFPGGSSAAGSPDQQTLLRLLNSTAPLTIELIRQPNSGSQSKPGGSIPEMRAPSSTSTISVRVTRQRGAYHIEGGSLQADNLPLIFDRPEAGTLFYLSPQRFSLSRSSMSEQKTLLPDASNLPAVLAYLQGHNRVLFERIEAHIVDIVPSVQMITIAPRGSDFEVLIWPNRHSNNSRFAFALGECGTGIAQILAILTAVVTSRQSVIAIDEVNTFLHSAAIKRLIAILRSEYRHHQYIMSSHSIDVMSSLQDSRVFQVSQLSGESSVSVLDLSDISVANKASRELGFSMLDVFGHDRVVWVEGPTEEAIFPMLSSRDLREVNGNIGFCSVSTTDAFSKTKSRDKQVISVYENAGKRLAPLLLGMAFGLDREKLSDQEVQHIERSKRKIRFLPRRCIESYLICPRAIANVINDLDGSAISPEVVLSFLVSTGSDRSLDCPSDWNGSISDSNWLKIVNAPRLLEKCFAHFTDFRFEYNKTRDSVSIFRDIMTSDPDRLSDLTTFVNLLIDIAERNTKP